MKKKMSWRNEVGCSTVITETHLDHFDFFENVVLFFLLSVKIKCYVVLWLKLIDERRRRRDVRKMKASSIRGFQWQQKFWKKVKWGSKPFCWRKRNSQSRHSSKIEENDGFKSKWLQRNQLRWINSKWKMEKKLVKKSNCILEKMVTNLGVLRNWRSVFVWKAR